MTDIERRIPAEHSLSVKIAMDIADNFIRNRSFRPLSNGRRRKAILEMSDIINKHIVTSLIDAVSKE